MEGEHMQMFIKLATCTKTNNYVTWLAAYGFCRI